MAEQGFETEYWIGAIDALTPDGVYWPQLDTAIVNASLPRSIDPLYPGAREKIIYLGQYCDAESIKKHRQEIIELTDQIIASRRQACQVLQEADQIKKEIQQQSTASLNLAKLNGMTQELAAQIFEQPSGEKHYFASAFTVDGLLDYIHEISQSCQKRVLIKGPTGSGKSMLIRNIAHQARENGYFLEYYHCGLEPDSFAMVIIPNLRIALIEAGEMEIPARPRDIVVDLSSCLDYNEANDLNESANLKYRRYERLFQEAQQQLEQSSLSNKALKKIYTEAMDFTKLNEIRLTLLAEMKD